jgi:lysine/ornithine N-monooxygenase
MSDAQGWQVCLSDGRRLNSRRVVLATGPGQLNYPRWSQAIEPVYHLSNLQYYQPDWQNFGHITVIGGALTSANFVLGVSRQKRDSLPDITLLVRSPLKTSILEANLSALTGEFQNRFKHSDYPTRRTLITQSRANGTIPAQVKENLLKTGVKLVQAEVIQAICQDGKIYLQLSNGTELETEAVVLGTGFIKGGWSNKLVMQVAQDYRINLSECGFAMPASNLEWLPGLYLMGGEAELELGPICRNLAGAGLGVARIMSSFDGNG